MNRIIAKEVPAARVDHKLLLAVSGLVFLRKSQRREPSAGLGTLALGLALVLAGIDIYYVAKEIIPPVYIYDAGAELVLAGCWVGVLRSRLSDL